MQHKTRTDGRRHEAVHGSTVDITTTAIPLVVSSLNLSPAPGRQSTDGTAEFSEAQDSGMRNIPWKSVAVDYPSVQGDCASHPCRNGGFCAPVTSGYACKCRRGYSGKNCESVSCREENFALIQPLTSRLSSSCKSVLSVKDNLITIDQCMKEACLSEGNTINYRVGECLVRRCEDQMLHLDMVQGAYDVYTYLETNPCETTSCMNGGVCLAMSNRGEHNALCHCKAGYTGSRCESEINHCLSEPCLHGKCERDDKGFICHCSHGYYGKHCNMDKPPYKYVMTVALTSVKSHPLKEPDPDTYKNMAHKLEEMAKKAHEKYIALDGSDSATFIVTSFNGKPITVTMEIRVSQIVNTNSLIEAMKREIETSLSYLPINGSSLEVMTSDVLFECNFEVDMCNIEQSYIKGTKRWQRQEVRNKQTLVENNVIKLGNYYIMVALSTKSQDRKWKMIIVSLFCVGRWDSNEERRNDGRVSLILSQSVSQSLTQSPTHSVTDSSLNAMSQKIGFRLLKILTLPSFTLPEVNANSGLSCLTFYYKSKGYNELEVGVYVSSADGEKIWQPFWRELMSPSDTWQQGFIIVNLTYGGNINFRSRTFDIRPSEVVIDGIKLMLDLNQCLAIEDEKCSEYAMGPHTDTCLKMMWTRYCLADAAGNPLHSRSTRDIANLGTMRSFITTVKYISDKANAGSKRDLRMCYGDNRKYVRLSSDRQIDGKNEGRIEVFNSGRWTTICDDDFDDDDADVACRQLGFVGGWARNAAFYGSGSGFIAVTKLNCSGSEDSLYMCRHMVPSPGMPCTHEEDAGVTCLQGGPNVYSIGQAEPKPIHQKMDEVRKMAILPSRYQMAKLPGRVRSIRLSTSIANIPFYIQIWRPTSATRHIIQDTEGYILVHEMKLILPKPVKDLVIKTSDLQFRNPPTGSSVFEFSPRKENRLLGVLDDKNGTANGNSYTRFRRSTIDQIYVEVGDILGVYFPEKNPIPYTTKECYSLDEHLRYSYGLDDVPVIGRGYDFKIAPLNWSPCRKYHIQADIEPDIPARYLDAKDNKPQTKEGILFSCKFEDNLCGMIQEVNHDQADWIWTGRRLPQPGIRSIYDSQGQYYIHLEASGKPYRDRAVIHTPWIEYTGPCCVRFQYLMTGFDVESLTLYKESKTGRGLIELWIETDTTSGWKAASLDLKLQGKFKLVFEATLSRSAALGDIALDEIVIVQGNCKESNRQISYKRNFTSEVDLESESLQDADVMPERYYLSKEGRDFDGCGTERLPCKTARQIFNLPSSSLIIIVDNSYLGHVYEVDMTLFGTRIQRLQIHGSCCTLRGNVDTGSSVIKLTSGHPLFLTVSEKSYYLRLFNLRIQGSLSIHSSRMFEMAMENVDFQPLKETNKLNVRSSSNFTLLVQNAKFSDVFLDLASKDSASIRLENVVMRPTGNSRKVGVLSHFSGNHKEYYVGIKNSSFENITHPLHNNMSAALSIGISGTNSHLKFLIEHSKFINNARALDLRVGGETDLHVFGSTFIGNVARGPGGALRISSNTLPGMHAEIPNVDKFHVTLDRCNFDSNAARATVGDNGGMSTGDGGAVYFQVSPPSMNHLQNLVLIRRCNFTNNSAASKGGSLFLGSDVNCLLDDVNVVNPLSFLGAKTDNVLRATGNLKINQMNIQASPSTSDKPVFYYQMGNVNSNGLYVNGFNLLCPKGFVVHTDLIRSGSDDSRFDLLEIFCRPCPSGRYITVGSRCEIDTAAAVAVIPINLTCHSCPYGAVCNRGIRSKLNFWGVERPNGMVYMYPCPDDYCDTDETHPVAMSSCAVNRRGTLCGGCDDGYSEALWGTRCIANTRCLSTYGWVATLIGVYGIIYLVFFMLLDYLSALLQYLASTLSCGRRPRHRAATWNMGYFQIFLYFIQTASLLTFDMFLVDGAINKLAVNPHDVLHPFLINGIQKLLRVRIQILEENSCLVPDLTPTGKMVIKLSFFACLYCILFIIFIIGWLCSLGKRMRHYGIGLAFPWCY
ncbi:hypothetical protein LSH36_21g02016 [Paralvinella palmiformis]|uniref:Uncharacterized protein n=1 Tax=Paralvinella palmiformis TaxID=53620 RepID=A0AAD9NI51_9ANNE|nr:hypothetical protein LSH36_21g02016 [Paralvinella palmiformis]